MTARRSLLITVSIVSLAMTATTACAGPPDDRARKARASLVVLRAVEKGEKWAPDEYASAAAALDAAERESRAQAARFFLTRDYGKAAELYARAIEDVAMARDAARAGKESAEKQARDALDAALAAIQHAQTALTVAPVSRDSRSSFDQFDQQLDHAALRLDEERNLIVAEDYKHATERSGEILEQVTSMLRNVSRGARH